MFKRICKSKPIRFIREQLLKIDWLNQKVQAFRIKRERQRIERQLKRYHRRWELIMRGHAVQNNETEKSDHRTLVDVTDDGINVDHMDGRFVGQRTVGPVFIDSVNWGGM